MFALSKLCDGYLTSAINKTNFLHFLKFSNSLPDDFVVKKSCWKYILVNLLAIPQEVFVTFELDVMKSLLSEDSFGLENEGVLLGLLIKWIEHNEWRKQHAFDMFVLIKFPFVPRGVWKDFLQHPLCSQEVKSLMVLQMCSNEVKPRKDILTSEPFEFLAVNLPTSGHMDSEPFHRYGWCLKIRVIVGSRDDMEDSDEDFWSIRRDRQYLKLSIIKVGRNPGADLSIQGSAKFRIVHPADPSKSKILNIIKLSLLRDGSDSSITCSSSHTIASLETAGFMSFPEYGIKKCIKVELNLNF